MSRKHDIKNCETCQKLLKQFIEVLLALNEHVKEIEKGDLNEPGD